MSSADIARTSEPAVQHGDSRRALRGLLLLAPLLSGLGGCGVVEKALGIRKPVHFPVRSLSEKAAAVKAFAAYDADHNGKADFFTFADATGRVNRIAYDHSGNEKPDVVVPLDAIPFGQCRHLVIILDGLGYEVAKACYDQGKLRMFHPPSKVVAPYPSMTDLCLVDALRCMPCRGVEALYYDRKAGGLAGGVGSYLRGANQPYNARVHYQASTFWHALGYLWPWQIFGKEINDAKRFFDKARTREMIAYFVSSAGVSTRSGAQGQRKCLERVEQFANQVVYETRGMTKVTLFSDHGHSYKRARRIPLESHLKDRAWRLTSRLRRPRDVVYLRFGLVTFAAFMANDAPGLARDLVACEGVELASYAEEDRVVVLAPNGGRAVIRHKGGRHKYQPLAGDPLQLNEILPGAGADTDGFIGAEAELTATVDHVYPAPLQRLWRAHFARVENPPDVIASLGDAFYSGARSFGRSVTVASTHGSLNRRNSVACIMSTGAGLPPVMRSQDIPGHMAAATGQPWPLGR